MSRDPTAIRCFGNCVLFLTTCIASCHVVNSADSQAMEEIQKKLSVPWNPCLWNRDWNSHGFVWKLGPTGWFFFPVSTGFSQWFSSGKKKLAPPREASLEPRWGSGEAVAFWGVLCTGCFWNNQWPFNETTMQPYFYMCFIVYSILIYVVCIAEHVVLISLIKKGYNDHCPGI